jgi:hypothetical protein
MLPVQDAGGRPVVRKRRGGARTKLIDELINQGLARLRFANAHKAFDTEGTTNHFSVIIRESLLNKFYMGEGGMLYRVRPGVVEAISNFSKPDPPAPGVPTDIEIAEEAEEFEIPEPAPLPVLIEGLPVEPPMDWQAQVDELLYVEPESDQTVDNARTLDFEDQLYVEDTGTTQFWFDALLDISEDVTVGDPHCPIGITESLYVTDTDNVGDPHCPVVIVEALYVTTSVITSTILINESDTLYTSTEAVATQVLYIQETDNLYVEDTKQVTLVLVVDESEVLDVTTESTAFSVLNITKDTDLLHVDIDFDPEDIQRVDVPAAKIRERDNLYVEADMEQLVRWFPMPELAEITDTPIVWIPRVDVDVETMLDVLYEEDAEGNFFGGKAVPTLVINTDDVLDVYGPDLFKLAPYLIDPWVTVGETVPRDINMNEGLYVYGPDFFAGLPYNIDPWIDVGEPPGPVLIEHPSDLLHTHGPDYFESLPWGIDPWVEVSAPVTPEPRLVVTDNILYVSFPDPDAGGPLENPDVWVQPPPIQTSWLWDFDNPSNYQGWTYYSLNDLNHVSGGVTGRCLRHDYTGGFGYDGIWIVVNGVQSGFTYDLYWYQRDSASAGYPAGWNIIAFTGYDGNGRPLGITSGYWSFGGASIDNGGYVYTSWQEYHRHYNDSDGDYREASYTVPVGVSSIAIMIGPVFSFAPENQYYDNIRLVRR